jgi:hypothetical protein
LYENIGPVTNLFGPVFAGRKDIPEQTMLLVRVIKAIKASEPENINQTFSTKTVEFSSGQELNDPNSNKELPKNVFSIKEKVAEDLKKFAAMDTTKAKAEEFITLAAKNGWDSALDKFNELYLYLSPENEADPNAFSLRSIPNLRRISGAALQTLAVQVAGSTRAQFIANEGKKQAWFVAQLYSLVPPDSNTPATLPLVMEFKPDMSFYCLKNLSVNHLWQEDYEKIEARCSFKEDYAQAQSLMAVHFNPENILKRMNFIEVGKEKKTPEATAPAEPEPVTE